MRCSSSGRARCAERCSRALPDWVALAPGWCGLRGLAARLGAAAVKSSGSCGGCDNCGSEGGDAQASAASRRALRRAIRQAVPKSGCRWRASAAGKDNSMCGATAECAIMLERAPWRRFPESRKHAHSPHFARLPATAGDRCAHVHRLDAEARARAVQGGHRRVVSGAQRAAGGAARRLAQRDHRDPGCVPTGGPVGQDRAVRRQSDRPRQQRSTGARREAVRRSTGFPSSSPACGRRPRSCRRCIPTAASCSTT